MLVAVELYFDEVGEAQVRKLVQTLGDRNIPPHLERLGFQPHISLTVLADTAVEPVVALVRRVALSLKPIAMDFSYVGAFPTKEGVAFLAPLFTEHLRRTHQTFHTALEHAGLVSHPYYLPDRWVPHCTMTTDLTADELGQAVQVLSQEFKPFSVQCTALGVISVRPLVRHGRFPLARE